MTEPRLVAIHRYKPHSPKWKALFLHVGKTLSGLAEAGYTLEALRNLSYTKQLVFDPPLSKMKRKIPQASKTARKCIRCEKAYEPSHRFNRMCPRCNANVSDVSPYAI